MKYYIRFCKASSIFEAFLMTIITIKTQRLGGQRLGLVRISLGVFGVFGGCPTPHIGISLNN